MFDQLIQFDEHLFSAINHGLSNPFFDWLMPYLRNRFFWTPLYLFIAVFFVRNYGKQGWTLLLFFVLTFAVTDFFTAKLIKPNAQRIRPCNDPEMKPGLQSRIACGSGYSFPSTHAANHFALAMFLITIFYKRWKPILPLALAWAAAISFAQVYVGVHYPFDVTCGAIIGSLLGYLTATFLIAYKPYFSWKAGN